MRGTPHDPRLPIALAESGFVRVKSDSLGPDGQHHTEDLPDGEFRLDPHHVPQSLVPKGAGCAHLGTGENSAMQILQDHDPDPGGCLPQACREQGLELR